MIQLNTNEINGVSLLKDVQNKLDDRGIAIQKVGINDVFLPFLIKTKNGSFQSVLAKIKLTVDLPHQYKGTHMSRFVEILSEWSQKPVGSKEMEQILHDTTEKLEANSAHLQLQFKYFIEKEAPVSGLKSLLDIECVFKANYKKNKKLDFTMGVKVPVTSLCPCSKEISAFGAHNQRSIINAKIKYPHEQIIWIEDLVGMIEGEASCPIYPLLKREDEKYVTEFAYNNPKFVEDILRDLVLSFRTLQSLVWFEIECENYESIHNHSAYASHVEFID